MDAATVEPGDVRYGRVPLERLTRVHGPSTDGDESFRTLHAFVKTSNSGTHREQIGLLDLVPTVPNGCVSCGERKRRWLSDRPGMYVAKLGRTVPVPACRVSALVGRRCFAPPVVDHWATATSAACARTPIEGSPGRWARSISLKPASIISAENWSMGQV